MEVFSPMPHCTALFAWLIWSWDEDLVCNGQQSLKEQDVLLTTVSSGDITIANSSGLQYQQAIPRLTVNKVEGGRLGISYLHSRRLAHWDHESAQGGGGEWKSRTSQLQDTARPSTFYLPQHRLAMPKTGAI